MMIYATSLHLELNVLMVRVSAKGQRKGSAGLIDLKIFFFFIRSCCLRTIHMGTLLARLDGDHPQSCDVISSYGQQIFIWTLIFLMIDWSYIELFEIKHIVTAGRGRLLVQQTAPHQRKFE
ncbi:hypothetical protein FKM82_024965 [Ascaphus truei]